MGAPVPTTFTAVGACAGGISAATLGATSVGAGIVNMTTTTALASMEA